MFKGQYASVEGNISARTVSGLKGVHVFIDDIVKLNPPQSMGSKQSRTSWVSTH